MAGIKVKITDLAYSLFNQELFAEAKSNIDIVQSYFKANARDNKVIQSLIQFIGNNDYEGVTPTRLQYELEKIDTIMDEEVDAVIKHIKKWVKMDDKEILKDYAERLRRNCLSQNLINCQAQSGDDIDLFYDLMNKFEYKDTYSDEMQIKKLSEVDEEKAMKDSFSKFAEDELQVIKSAYPAVDAWLSAQQIIVVGEPGGGKSLFMMRCSKHFCMQGKRGIYVALGDLTEASFIVRLGAQLLGCTLTEAARRSKACMEAIRKEIGDNLFIACVPANKISIERFMRKIKSRINDYDFIVVDYDANFKSKGDLNMYLEGGEIYSNLSEFTITYKKLVLVGSQPNKRYYGKSYLPKECAAESSKKQQFVDGMITIGNRAGSTLPLGYLAFVKNRNGNDRVRIPYVRTSDGEFHEVSYEVYAQLKDYRDREEISFYELQQLEDKFSAHVASSSVTRVAGPVTADPDFFENDETDNDNKDNLPY